MARRKELKGPGPGRLPDFARLAEKSPADLIRTLKRFGLEPDIREIARRGRQVYASHLGKLLEERGIPDEATWKGLFSAAENALADVLSSQVKRAIYEYRKQRVRGTAKYFVWISVVDQRRCPSCVGRHSKRKTMRQWEAVGEPGSEVLACKKRCRCHLLPDIGADLSPEPGEEDYEALIQELGRRTEAGLMASRPFG